MVSIKSVNKQLKRIHYTKGWNRAEAEELANILLTDEECFECVNGWYEGGFAILVATDVRVLLVDKKPLKILNVEDLRFDTINQIDYSHRLSSASICISSGLKTLKFSSYNQPRLRKLIGHVQSRMAEIKRMEEQARMGINNHSMSVDDMDQQLRSYLLSRYEQHESLMRQHEPILPPIEVSSQKSTSPQSELVRPSEGFIPANSMAFSTGASADELYEDGIREVFGKTRLAFTPSPVKTAVTIDDSISPLNLSLDDGSQLDPSPMRIAYSKLPMILRIRRRQPARYTR